ncbi:hypothetical protein GU243_08955 [Pseudarthrobacter psychrotolerans]|uniref:Uncharacterized protein n=1 Tax=Pseudarthrobacter psychrotolerans TaxID=2697569 RepID=A0A6P1NMT4_9MICC|nr:hypothetical protein [Pseudarthrobacter psychrotolerans]QHK19844.1 hypothetical protein GU243_08955 [Pseudarthrobacter psychrotolerans]
MSELIPRPSGKITPFNAPEGFSRSEGKALQRRQNTEVANGLITAARVQAAGYVAATGMHLTGMLSREAQFQSDGDSRTSERLNYIADSFAEYAAWEVRRFQR